jgi:hypothetical protein
MFLLTLWFLGAGTITAFGLLCCFWRDEAIKCARIWTHMIRIQQPDADWRSLDRTMVPPRIVGFLMFLAGLWLLFLPLPALFGHVSMPVVAVPAAPSPRQGVDWTLAISAICFLGLSVYMLIDPIGLFCFFTRQKRDKYPPKYKRGWAATVTALLFIITSGLLILRIVKQ